MVSPGGETIEVTAYTPDGKIDTISRAITENGTTTTDSLKYEYDGNGRISQITFRRTTNPTADIRRVKYAYYGSGEDHGSPGDLKTVTTQILDGVTWTDHDVSYFRYYTSGQANGFVHGLKYALQPEAYQRLKDDPAVSDPFTASNAKVADYADNYFEYDSQQRATKSVIQGGLLTYTYAYATSAFADDYNNWKHKTTTTRPDGSQEIVYANYITQIMLRELVSGSDNWIEYHQYDSQANEILHAMPSAVSGYDGNAADLDVTLHANAGLIHVTEYYASTTATESVAGGVKDYEKSRSLKNGSSGTAIKQSEVKYFARTAGDAKAYPIAEQTVYRNEDGTGAITTSFDYTWHAGTTQIDQETTTLPVIPTSQNGSGVANTQTHIFDIYGRMNWLRDPRGFITYQKFDPVTGAMQQRIEDCDGTKITLPAGWSTPAGGGLHLITDFEFDALGRLTQSLGPSHNIDGETVRTANWTVYKDLDNETRTGQGYATGTAPNYTYTLVNPVNISIRAEDGLTTKQITATRASTSGKLAPEDDFPQSSWVRLSVDLYNKESQQTASRLYFDIPTSGDGSSGTNYNETTFGYDQMNRQNMTKTPGGTITRTVFDVRSQVEKVYVGTDDTGATDADPTGGGATGNNMVLTRQNEYDNGNDGGDGNLTEQTLPVDSNSANDRVTSFLYDFRNRQMDIDGEIDLYIENIYDNLDRVTRVNRYDTTKAAGNLVGRQETLFDDQGRVYRTLVYAVTVGTGTVGNSLAANAWFDASGNTIKRVDAGAKDEKAFAKVQYDGVGRQIGTYIGDYTGMGTESYADAGEITSDNKIFLQTLSTYDDAGNVIQQDDYQRFHNATGNGELSLPTGAQPKARVSYTATWYDGIGRQTATANYGTNGDSALTRPDTAPAGSDTVLVTSIDYNDRGEASETTDPAGTVQRNEFDDADRRTKKIDNYVSGGPTNSDTNVTTEFTYNADGRQKTITAKNATTGDQTTTYDYGTTLADSDIASNELLVAETYPDSVDGSDKINYTYNRQGERTSKTDQNGSVHDFDYDKLGRPTNDRVTTLAAGVDGAVRRLGFSYDARGLVEKITSYDNATIGSGTVVNEVQNAYNAFEQLTTQYQEHGGAVNVSTSPKVGYAYADGSDNTIRQTSITYPNGRVIDYAYGTADSDNDLLGRIQQIKDGSTVLAEYTYLGMIMFVQVDYTEPDVRYDLITGGSSTNPYGGLDRLGRVTDLLWQKYSGTPTDLVRLGYGYDRVSNRTYREDKVAPSGFDELYAYDGIHRLKDFDRGDLNATKDAITSPTLEQSWGLDATGNWSSFDQNLPGSSSQDLTQSRTHNKVNEITNITETVGASWVTPQHDRNGNMTFMPQPAEPTEGFTATYDAWNRLVKLEEDVEPGSSSSSSSSSESSSSSSSSSESGSSSSSSSESESSSSSSSHEPLVVTYAYDGRNWRTEKDVNGETTHFYYSSGWQCLEERKGTLTDAHIQYVWGLRYIDDLVFRDRDTTENGELEERIYGLQNTNWNIIALTDSNGSVQERYTYTAYGESSLLAAAFSARSTSLYAWTYRFAGRELDEETVLYCYRMRYYNSALGRFISRDPFHISEILNYYEFLNGQPLSAVDPFGRQGLKVEQVPLSDEIGQRIFEEKAKGQEVTPKLVQGIAGFILVNAPAPAPKLLSSFGQPRDLAWWAKKPKYILGCKEVDGKRMCGYLFVHLFTCPKKVSCGVVAQRVERVTTVIASDGTKGDVARETFVEYFKLVPSRHAGLNSAHDYHGATFEKDEDDWSTLRSITHEVTFEACCSKTEVTFRGASRYAGPVKDTKLECIDGDKPQKVSFKFVVSGGGKWSFIAKGDQINVQESGNGPKLPFSQ